MTVKLCHFLCKKEVYYWYIYYNGITSVNLTGRGHPCEGGNTMEVKVGKVVGTMILAAAGAVAAYASLRVIKKIRALKNRAVNKAAQKEGVVWEK